MELIESESEQEKTAAAEDWTETSAAAGEVVAESLHEAKEEANKNLGKSLKKKLRF